MPDVYYERWEWGPVRRSLTSGQRVTAFAANRGALRPRRLLRSSAVDGRVYFKVDR